VNPANHLIFPEIKTPEILLLNLSQNQNQNRNQRLNPKQVAPKDAQKVIIFLKQRNNASL
jgi:hypothetical protein